MKMQTKQVPCLITKQGEKGDEGVITITTSNPDLQGDRVLASGVEFERFVRGTGAVNYAHDADTCLPVAKTVAILPVTDGLSARFVWRMDPFSKEVESAFHDGVLGASIEFVPTEEPKKNSFGGFDFPRVTLGGLALTPRPANMSAVRGLSKSMHTILAQRPMHPVMREAIEVLSDMRRLIERERNRIEAERRSITLDYASALLTIIAAEME